MSLQVDARVETDSIPALLRETSFAVVDVETTGFSPVRGDRIVEIAVVRLSPAETTEIAFSLLVDPRGFEPLTFWLPARRSTS